MAEIRVEIPDDEVKILDGYCSGTGKGRTDVIRHLLHEWSEAKLRQSIMICRVAGVTPTIAEVGRNPAGRITK